MVASLALAGCGKSSSSGVPSNGAASSTSTQSIAASTNAVQVTNGVWSSPDATFTVSADGSSLQLSCGSGSTSAPLNLDSSQSFQVTGVYTVGEGTIYSTNNIFGNQSAVFSGSIDSTGQIMSLQVEYEGSDVPFVNLQLQLNGQFPPFAHCL